MKKLVDRGKRDTKTYENEVTELNFDVKFDLRCPRRPFAAVF